MRKIALLTAVVALIIGWFVWPSIFSYKSRITVVTATPSLLVWSYDPITNRAVVWQLPDNLQIPVVGGYGFYLAQSVAGLDIQEKQQGRLVRESAGYFLGVGVDREIITVKTHELPLLLDKQWLEKVWWQNMWLKPWLVKLWWVSRHLRPDQVEIIDLKLSNSLTLDSLPDGSAIYKADLQQVTSLAQRYMTDEKLVNEGIEVLVTNATDSQGLGSEFSRLLSTVGIRVVGVEDDTEKLETTMLLVQNKDMKRLLSIKYLEKLLQIPVVISPQAGGRASVKVRLGKDYQKRVRSLHQ